MQTPKLESKRIFLIVSDDELLTSLCRSYIQRHISNPTIFSARDGAEALFKVDNVIPHVVFIDPFLDKLDGFQLVDHLLRFQADHRISTVLLSEIPNSELYVDEVVTRQVQFLSNYQDEASFTLCLARALNHISFDEDSTYRIHFFAPNEVLFEQGDKAESVFIVRKGELEVTHVSQDKKVVIGRVGKSEFVGEMAHFNNENRSATVRALTDCELIEIPMGVLDMVLFSKPAWSKALVETLSRRLKKSNAVVVKSTG